jgi:uncharacterized protein YeeX (DUF496 family)
MTIDEYKQILTQFIENKQYDCAQILLDELAANQGKVNRGNRFLKDTIIFLAIESQSIDALKLVNHVICHNESENELGNIKVDIAYEILNQKAYDFIVPCVLASLTNMENITYSMMSYGDSEVAHYILNHPQLEFDKSCLLKCFHLFFEQDEAVALLSLLKDFSSLNSQQVHEGFRSCFQSNCIKGIEYLIEHQKELTIELLKKVSHQESEEYSHVGDFLAGMVFQEQAPEFLSYLLSLIRTHCPIENENDLTKSMLLPFIRNQKYIPLETLGQFVNDNYSFHDIEFIVQFLKHEEQDTLADFVQGFSEKKKIENNVNESIINHTKKSIKL